MQNNAKIWHEGYIAGQKSMDAEHYAVALRLRQLPLDEDSHGNLSQIARAVWHNDFGWTQGACKGLRDELIRLLGGVHDEPVSMDASCGADCADCDCGAGESGRVTYDVLGNERHKAVCALRKIQTDAGGFVKALAEAVGVEWQAPRVTQTIAEVRDRLIHLLGGDEPYSNLTRTILEPNLPKSAETAKPESEDGGKVTITDELREFKGHINAELTPEMVLALRAEINCTANRIDAQFRRLCWQQEAVLQQTIDSMVDERDELQGELDETRDALNRAAGKWAKAREEKRELQERLERSRAEYCETCEEAKTTDILRAKLDAIREALDG